MIAAVSSLISNVVKVASGVSESLPAAVIGGCHDTSTKNAGGACNHGASRCRPWAAHAATSGRPSSGWSSSGPSANAAATTRDATTTAPWSTSLALVARALALEWSALGLGLRKMVVVARHPRRHRYRYR